MLLKKLNQKGFSAIEGLLILVIIGIVGGTIFYVVKANKNVSTGSDGTTIAKQEPKKEKQKPEQPKLPELVDYGEQGVVLQKKSDVEKLKDSSELFKTFIGGYLEDEPKYENGCEYALRITVEKIYKDEFAEGGIGACGGARYVWKKENNQWTQAYAGQQAPLCSEVEKHGVPNVIEPECYKEGKLVKNPN